VQTHNPFVVVPVVRRQGEDLDEAPCLAQSPSRAWDGLHTHQHSEPAK
jgi:hypothetical protein